MKRIEIAISFVVLISLTIACGKDRNDKDTTECDCGSGGENDAAAESDSSSYETGGVSGEDDTGGISGRRDAGSAGATSGRSGQDGESDAGAESDASVENDASEPDTETDEIVDPAPQYTDPGAYDCTGCPSSERNEFIYAAGSVTAIVVSGTVTDADGNGSFYSVGENGEELYGTIPTDEATGAYSVKIPLFCGAQTLKLTWSNNRGTYVEVLSITTQDCVAADIRITLSWDELGLDWELHLIKEGGRINDDATDCTWTSCIHTWPDWGVAGDSSDDPRKDVDDTDSYGPENISLANPESGTYTVMVEHYGSGSDESDGEVIFNVAGSVVVAQIKNLASHFVWTAGTIEWPAGVVNVSDAIYDCSDNWSNGCRDEIP